MRVSGWSVPKVLVAGFLAINAAIISFCNWTQRNFTIIEGGQLESDFSAGIFCEGRQWALRMSHSLISIPISFRIFLTFSVVWWIPSISKYLMGRSAYNNLIFACFNVFVWILIEKRGMNSIPFIGTLVKN